jgi:16S rRNA (cytosine967-C5)-methyltransferase
MRDGARAQAAIEVLTDSVELKRPPALALKDWANRHRFAGSKDRSAIGDIVFMAMRIRAQSTFAFGSESPRAWVLGALKWGFGLSNDAICALSKDNEHSIAEPTEQELKCFDASFENCDSWVIGNYPKWLDEELQKAFGDNRGAEMAALSKPAPLDFRVNTLKSDIDNLIKELSTSPKLVSEIVKTPLSKIGARLAWSNGKSFPFAVEPSFLRGEFEVQDEASQLCAQLTGAKEGQRIADVCAGGGGKTLALGALTNNKAKIIAYDTDPNRIAPIHERLRRAGIDADVRTQRRGIDTFKDINDKCDIVLVDAPCTGAGTWRRAPDTKWKLTPQNIEKRQFDQQSALNLAMPLVKAGGMLAYVTCSILPCENDESVEKFLTDFPQFEAKPIMQHLQELNMEYLADFVHFTKYGIQFTPLKSNTDGFFFAPLIRPSEH